jgi:hypothetical protein
MLVKVMPRQLRQICLDAGHLYPQRESHRRVGERYSEHTVEGADEI